MEKMFEAMDTNKDGKLILSEAESFFKTFKTLTAKAMFNEVKLRVCLALVRLGEVLYAVRMLAFWRVWIIEPSPRHMIAGGCGWR